MLTRAVGNRDRDMSAVILSSLKTEMLDDDEQAPESIQSSTSPNHSKKVVTAWKGQIVPMNDHSDKEAVLYSDPNSNKHYRFILHRRNHQKADNYACARCKSRKKYVRILIAGEYFLEDPASLDHICYLNQEELRENRERSIDQKNKDMMREKQKITAQLQSAKDFKEQTPNKQTDKGLLPAIARILEHDDPSILDSSSESLRDEGELRDSLCSSILDTLLKNMPKQESGEPQIKRLRKEEKPDPDPQEPTPQNAQTQASDVFSISLKRALDGILPENRAKAENEILRYVYSTLYAKYGAT
ncbi:unnamed protein product [Auanema sp. JU1783]|nr:unnamed protein product [Auanema sp. JU1783]